MAGLPQNKPVFVHWMKEPSMKGHRMLYLDVTFPYTKLPIKESVEYMCGYIESYRLRTCLPIEDLKTNAAFVHTLTSSNFTVEFIAK